MKFRNNNLLIKMKNNQQLMGVINSSIILKQNQSRGKAKNVNTGGSVDKKAVPFRLHAELAA